MMYFNLPHWAVSRSMTRYIIIITRSIIKTNFTYALKYWLTICNSFPGIYLTNVTCNVRILISAACRHSSIPISVFLKQWRETAQCWIAMWCLPRANTSRYPLSWKAPTRRVTWEQPLRYLSNTGICFMARKHSWWNSVVHTKPSPVCKEIIVTIIIRNTE